MVVGNGLTILGRRCRYVFLQVPQIDLEHVGTHLGCRGRLGSHTYSSSISSGLLVTEPQAVCRSPGGLHLNGPNEVGGGTVGVPATADAPFWLGPMGVGPRLGVVKSGVPPCAISHTRTLGSPPKES